MDNKKLILFALAAAVSGGASVTGAALAVESAVPAVSSGAAAEPGPVEDGMPWPPDGVTDPNVEYPTDATEGISEGEMAAEQATPDHDDAGNDDPADGADTEPNEDGNAGSGSAPGPSPD